MGDPQRSKCATLTANHSRLSTNTTILVTKKSLHIYTHTHTIKLVQMSHLFDILNTFAQHREIQDN